MGKFFENLGAVLVAGFVLAILIMVLPDSGYRPPTGDQLNAVLQWSHVFFGITWIGLLYYFNFVQIPTMPSVPAELKPGISKHIAPVALFYFRWGAVFTVLTGAALAWSYGELRQALMLELDYRRRSFAGQILDGVLVAEPVRPFDRVVHVPGPVVRAHVAEACGNAPLGRDSMAAGWEDLGYARGLQPLFGRAHRRPQSGTAGADDNDVIGVIDDLVCAHAAAPVKAIRARANKAIAPPPTARNSSRVFNAKLFPASWT